MNFRNCFSSILNRLALFYLLLNTIIQADNRSLKRAKRLTSPMRDARTAELAQYVVSLRSRQPQIMFGDNHYCGGAIIAPRFVITAAMCTMSKYKCPHMTRAMVVVAGTPNRLLSVNTTVSKHVRRVFVPNDYIQKNTNNIAIIMIEGSWPDVNPAISIIKLPVSQPSYDVTYTVLGWGRLYKGGPLAGNLVHIDVTLLPRNSCASMLKNLYPEMLCAGNFDGKLDQNPCAGDTGSPLVNNNTLVGIVSHRIGCGTTEMPSIYTDVWYHIEWINQTLESTVNHLEACYWSLLTFLYISLLV